MKQWKAISVCGVVGVVGIWGARLAWADQVLTSSLQPTETGGMRAAISQKLTLVAEKPTSLVKEPAYRYTPRYGVIGLGDAKENQIIVVLDAKDSALRPRLFVDSNANGDLTDELPIVLTEAKEDNATGAKSGAKYTASVPATARYTVVGRGGRLAGNIAFTIWDNEVSYNREYGRSGSLLMGTKTYKIALIDQSITGRFDELKHSDDDPAKVSIAVDRNGDGKFNPQNEIFDLSKPFRLGGRTLTLSNIDARGTKITLQASEAKARSKATTANLRVNGDAIEFEMETMDGDYVSFPDDFKGKLVMLDFWATWCPPCVEEVPNLVANYEKRHKQGFEILGISLDRDSQTTTVKRFMKQYGMTWAQVYDGKYWDAEIAKLYGVNSIPRAILVDGDTGKIVAMGDTLRGPSLEFTLQKAIQNHKAKANAEGAKE